MKKTIFLSFLIAVIAIGSTTSCSNSENTESKTGTEATVKNYYCPMKCEGEKMYAEKGSCPVCGMDLVKK